MTLPIFFDFRPAKNHSGIVPHTDIYFAATDPDGLNILTLQVVVNGVRAIINGQIQSGFSGSITKSTPAEELYFINVNPDANFLFGTDVTIGLSIEDKLGNKFSEHYSFSIIENPDKIPPLTIPVPRGGLYNSSQNIELHVFDPSISDTYYTTDGTNPISNGILYTTPIAFTSEGIHTLKFYSKDETNTEEVKTETYTLDFTPPVTSINLEGSTFLNPQTIVLTTNEEATIYYTLDGTWPTITSSTYSQSLNISNEGVTTLRYFAVDLAGNVESTHTQVYTLTYAKSNFAPSNAIVTSPYIRGKLDIVWDDMERLDSSVLGYNVYRSYFYNGPYVKLNDSTITTTAYRDEATDVEIIEEDVSNQFKQIILLNKNASDSFSGNTIDKTKWIEYDDAEIISQSDGLLINDPNGVQTKSKIVSIFKFKNDFDIRVGLDLIKWYDPLATHTEIGISVSKANGDNIVLSRKKSQTIDTLGSVLTINGTPDIPVVTTNNQSIISLRITRSDSNITTSYLDASGSVVLHNTFTNSFTDELYVSLFVNSGDVPLEARFFDFEVLSGEVAIIKLLNPQLEYVIKTSRRPIVDSVIGPTGNTKDTDIFKSALASQPEFVKVWIDGIRARIKSIYGLEGEIVLDTERYWDNISRQYVYPPVPSESSTVKVTYSVRGHDVDYSLRKPLYYKVTLEHDCGETDLRYAKAVTLQGDALDWMYAEGLRRNQWLLDQAGERVLLFVKSRAGQRCECYELNERTHRQPKNKCKICYGTGFIPPYAKPVCITISPLMAEQKLMQTDRGMRLDYVTEVWTITPHILNQRDFIVRKDGTILGIGPLTVPEVRGRRLEQQHFTIQPVDRSDIRYDYLESLNVFERRKELGLKCETITDAPVDTCADIPSKGRTITFKNITF